MYAKEIRSAFFEREGELLRLLELDAELRFLKSSIFILYSLIPVSCHRSRQIPGIPFTVA